MQVELSITNSSVTSTKRRNRTLLAALGLGSLLLVATLYVANINHSNSTRNLLESTSRKSSSTSNKNADDYYYDDYGYDYGKNTKTTTGKTTTGSTTTGKTTTGTTTTGSTTTTKPTTGTTTGSTTTTKPTTGTTTTPTTGTTTGSTTTTKPTTGTTTTPTTGTTTGSTTTTKPTTGTTTTPTTGTTTPTTGSTTTTKPTTGTTTPTTGTTTPTTGTTTPTTGTTTPTTGTTTTPAVDPSVLTYQTGQKCTNGLTAYLSGLNAAQKAEILKAHNTFRSTIALGKAPGQPGATDMLEMVWDDEVAAKAQAWADHCAFEHDSDAGMATSKFKFVGQNLDIYVSSKKLAKISLSDMVKDLYDEVNLYNGQSAPVSSYVYDDGTGHYTQIAWAKTYALGCGFKVYMDGGMYSYQLTCNYGPGGNYDGDKMYTKGTFDAAKCKNGASATYPGLCKA